MARRRAILIGNEGFPEESGFGPLRGAHNDVAALERVLTDQSRGAFEPAAVMRDAPFAAMHDAIEDTLKEAGQDDTILIHYSGHGDLDWPDGRLHLAGIDTLRKRLRRTALRASDLRAMVRASNARAVVLLLDCCFAGAIGAEFTRGDAVEASLRETAADANGLFILASSSAERVSLEGEREGEVMGRFTRALIERIGSTEEAHLGDVRFSHLGAHAARALAGQEAKTFVINGQGDPLIARAVPRQTAIEKAAAVLGVWWHDGDLTLDQFRGLVAIIAGTQTIERRGASLSYSPHTV
jgi:hypothetical protein